MSARGANMSTRVSTRLDVDGRLYDVPWSRPSVLALETHGQLHQYVLYYVTISILFLYFYFVTWLVAFDENVVMF